MFTSCKQSSLYKRKIHTAPVYNCDPETNPDLQSDLDLESDPDLESDLATEFDPTMQSNKSNHTAILPQDEDCYVCVDARSLGVLSRSFFRRSDTSTQLKYQTIMRLNQNHD